MAESSNWLILIYKIPPEPSRYRVALWRRLKGAGAVYLQNSVCILPDSPANRELFQDLYREIEESGGESLILEAKALNAADQERIIDRFNAERDEEYSEFLEQCEAFLAEIRHETERQNFIFGELEENEEGLQRLVTWLQKIERRDFFGAAKAAEARKRLTECQEALEAFYAKVFAASELSPDGGKRHEQR
ncbi:MAG: hypothetical protein L5656_09685 [Thermanaeromonas sp.]|uniref:Chromate resistance protein ChrB n=1 Tax=Thermanaeromonas sp. TaxID=2003697 RepID=UPI002437A45A|nr:Chromate resistance protein ChrB [Thermanaeromonas sp.]MCG0278782.1 hypothetical protein [Thermanaeromonas sp.]